jgi:hypothetical protein
LAFFEVEFAGGEDGDGFDALDAFWNPQIWNAGIAKFVAQLRKIDIYRAEQHDSFTFRFVCHANDGNDAFIFSRELE